MQKLKENEKLKYILVLLIATIIVVGGYFIYQNVKPSFSLNKEIVVDVNSEFNITDQIQSIKGYSKSDFKCDNSQVDTSKPGSYQITYTVKDQQYKTKVEVKDLTAPIVKVKEVTILVGDMLQVEQCIESVEDFSETKSIFKEEYTFDKVEDKEVGLVTADIYGNVTESTTTVHVVEDTTAPTLSGINDIKVSTGTKINFEKGVKIKDDFDKEPKYTFDASNVDVYKPGKYEVKYITEDNRGNKKEYIRKVTINEVKPVVTVAPSGDKVVYLTFDDGPSPRTPEVLDVLRRYNVKATFFVTGNGKKYNNYIKQAHDEGHTIALHTYTHNYGKVYASVDAYFDDLDKISSMVESIIGERPTHIRFPGGSSNTISRHYQTGIMKTLAGEVQARGYQYYDWNVSSGDASSVTPPTSKIIKNSINSSANNAMILMHDCVSKTTTVEALPTIIETYQARGYTFKAIGDGSFTPHHPINN